MTVPFGPQGQPCWPIRHDVAELGKLPPDEDRSELPSLDAHPPNAMTASPRSVARTIHARARALSLRSSAILPIEPPRQRARQRSCHRSADIERAHPTPKGELQASHVPYRLLSRARESTPENTSIKRQCGNFCAYVKRFVDWFGRLWRSLTPRRGTNT